jgi:hypothetical protein
MSPRPASALTIPPLPNFSGPVAPTYWSKGQRGWTRDFSADHSVNRCYKAAFVRAVGKPGQIERSAAGRDNVRSDLKKSHDIGRTRPRHGDEAERHRHAERDCEYRPA